MVISMTNISLMFISGLLIGVFIGKYRHVHFKIAEETYKKSYENGYEKGYYDALNRWVKIEGQTKIDMIKEIGDYFTNQEASNGRNQS